MNPIVCTDFYKVHHHRMMPEGTSLIFSNMTPRKSRMKGVESIVVFGIQHFIKKYLIGKFYREFFNLPWEDVEEEYKFAIDIDITHIKKLHDLGYLPIEIRALAEGEECPIRVPCLVIWNTLPEFSWVTNYLESLMSCQLWQPMTSATIAREYWKILSGYAKETTGSTDFVKRQAHDFSMRGMSSLESAILSGMGHLTSFIGTDTIPAIYALRNSYKAEGLIGGSVPASEHSIQCMHYDFKSGSEEDYFNRLLAQYPTGIVSAVSDGFDLWKVITETLPKMKDKIMSRDGKLVIRPDSGDPVDIICGDATIVDKISRVPVLTDSYCIEDGNHYSDYGMSHNHRWEDDVRVNPNPSPENKGVIELLWDIFGGTVNEKGYKVLDPHIGAIYGDSITLDRAEEICKRLKAKGFASTNIVFGVGSFTYQMNTRDTFGFAVKATYGEIFTVLERDGNTEVVIEPREIYKDPVTDDGTKKSAKGLLCVLKEGDKLVLKDQCTWSQVYSEDNQLKPVFRDGVLLKEWTLEEIRSRIKQKV